MSDSDWIKKLTFDFLKWFLHKSLNLKSNFLQIALFIRQIVFQIEFAAEIHLIYC
jgi:hypothetical protein